MSEAVEPVIKAVSERISWLKKLLMSSGYLLSNRIGHCECSKVDCCAECKESESLIKDIEQALNGEQK